MRLAVSHALVTAVQLKGARLRQLLALSDALLGLAQLGAALAYLVVHLGAHAVELVCYAEPNEIVIARIALGMESDEETKKAYSEIISNPKPEVREFRANAIILLCNTFSEFASTPLAHRLLLAIDEVENESTRQFKQSASIELLARIPSVIMQNSEGISGILGGKYTSTAKDAIAQALANTAELDSEDAIPLLCAKIRECNGNSQLAFDVAVAQLKQLDSVERDC